MATKNIRTVTYLPPELYKTLRRYEIEASLSESGTVAKIIADFFSRSSKCDPVAEIKIAALMKRIDSLEERVSFLENN